MGTIVRSLAYGAAAFFLLTAVMESRKAEAQSCPPGYRWSMVQRRCLKRCSPGFYFSYVDGRCKRRGRTFRKCPTGWYWNSMSRRCIKSQRCPTGFYYSYRDARCIRRTQARTCPYGFRYDIYSRRCVKRCPLGWTWSGSRCVKPVSRACPTGYRFDTYYRRCVRVNRRVCPSGTSWNGYRCASWKRCATGYYWSNASRRCKPKVTNCPYGYRYRAGWGCQRICPSGWYFSGGSCRKSARTCPEGQFYSAFRRRCVTRCGRGYYWNYRTHRCQRLSW